MDVQALDLDQGAVRPQRELGQVFGAHVLQDPDETPVPEGIASVVR
jgi:hypothetical protein